MSTPEQRRAFLIRRGREVGEAHFDPELDLVALGDRHTIQGSLWYALALLGDEDTDGRSRACRIIRKAIQTQDTDPENRWYGVLKTSWEAEGPADSSRTEVQGATLTSIYCRFRDRLDPATKERLTVALGRCLEALRRRDAPIGHTHCALLSGQSLLLGGQILCREDLWRLGDEKLTGWMAFTNLAGGPREYSSPTHTGLALCALAEVANFARDPGARLRAQAAEARIWLHLATHFHPATHSLGGPYGTVLGEGFRLNPSATVSCLYAVTGDEGLIEKLATAEDILGGITVGLSSFHCPGPVRELFLRKAYPCQALERTEVLSDAQFRIKDAGRLVVDHERGEFQATKSGSLNHLEDAQIRDTTCFMSGSYVLGTVNRQDVHPQRENVLCHYAAATDSRKAGGFKVVSGKFLASEDDDHPLHRQAIFSSAQFRNRAIVLYTCPPVRAEGVTVLGAFVEMPEKVEALYIGERKVARLPAEVPESAWVFFSDAGTYIGIRPLARTAFGRSSAARIERGEGVLHLTMYNYFGRSRPFQAERIGALKNGYLLEVGDRGEVKTFDAFRARVSRTKVEDRAGGGVRSVHWGTGSDGFSLEVDAGRNGEARRSFGGVAYEAPPLDSPNAVQSGCGHIQVGNASLSWTGGVPLVLIADRKQACVINPSSGTADLSLGVAGAKIRVGCMSPGHVILDVGRIVRVTLVVLSSTGPVAVETDGREFEIVRRNMD